MKYPLVVLSIAFGLGILVSAFIKIPFLVLYLLAISFLILSITFIKSKLRFSIFLLCLAFFIGVGLLNNSLVLPKHHIANFTAYRSNSVSIVGVIDGDPVYKGRNTSFIFKAEKLKSVRNFAAGGRQKGISKSGKIGEDWQRTCGKILVRVFGERRSVFYGDRLLLEGKLYRPFSYSQTFDYPKYLQRQGIYSMLSVKNDAVVKRLGKKIGNPIKSFAFGMRHRINQVYTKNLSFRSANILSAIILGMRENLSSDIREVLVKSGSVHIIAISGLHLGIAAFISLILLKIIGIPRRPRYILTIMFLIVYCILTGARTPVVRATVMATILLFGFFIEREVNIYNSLALAALIILAINPWQLFEVSFQLSFLSVICIVWLTPKIKSIFPKKLYKIDGLRIFILAFCVSTSAWLGLLPLIAYNFGIISPVAVLANMIIVPYMSIIVALGFGLGLLGMLISPLASILAASCQLSLVILFKINSLFIAIPGAYFKLPRISFAYVIIYYVLILILFNLKRIAGIGKSLPVRIDKSKTIC